MSRPAVFFDRDNTLIANDGYLGDPTGVVLIQGAADAIARARALGFAIVTFSNQSGVARGMFPEEAVHSVNSRLDELLLDQHPNARIDRHEFCPYHPDAVVERYKRDSDLRKPRPGMILQAAERLNLDLARSWVIGDAPRDIEAGKAVGCRAILFNDPSAPRSPAADEASAARPDFTVASLEEAVDIIEQNMLDKAQSDLASASGSRPQEATASEAEQPATEETAGHPHASESAPTEPESPEPELTAAKPAATVDEDAASRADEEQSQPTQSEAPTAPEPAPSASPRKMTFAERVRAGTFQPARAAAGTAGVVVAERPRRAVSEVVSHEPGSSAPAPVAHRTAPAPDPVVRPTEPVSQEELLEPLLQQILEELRLTRQQQPGTEFAVSKLLAGIVQVLVLPALFFAYLHRDSALDLQSMLMLATFLQTLTIALLIMGRQQ